MKQLFSIFTAVLAVLVFLVSCGGSEGSGSGGSGDSNVADETGSIYGVVTDKATGESIINAGVELQPVGLKTVTGSDGQFEFNEVATGTYTLYVTKTGYSDNSNDITVESGKKSKGDVQLEKLPAALRIVDDKGKDIDELDFGAEIADVSRQFNIFNDGYEKLEWELSFSAKWIESVSKESGELKAGGTLGVIVNIDRSQLESGENVTTVHVTSNDGNKQLTVKATNSHKKIKCQGLPEGAIWNKVEEIEQNWNGEEWLPPAQGSFNEEPSETECRFKCNPGYIFERNKCVDIDECADPELNKCPTHSDCANEDGTFSCVCHEGYSGNKCVANKRTKVCEDLPENAKWNKVEEIEQTWNGEEWTPSTQGSYNEEASEKECRFKCNTGYIWEGNKCINKKTSKCTGLLDHAHWNTVSQIEQTWNGQEWVPSLEGSYNEEASVAECRFECDTNYTWKGSSCEPESKTTACTGLPENAVWNMATSIVQTWNGVEWLPSSTGTYNEEETMSKCYFKCNANYTWKGATCEANTRTAECEGLPASAAWTTSTSVSQTWNGLEWIPSNQAVIDTGENTDACKFKCNTNYTYKNSQCEADTKTAECTGLPTNAVWNSVSSITQTWNGTSWQPSSAGVFDTAESTTECRFMCATNYVWKNSRCEFSKQTVDCTGLPANASWNSVSSIEQTWNGEEWQPSPVGTYNTAESTSECRFKCNTNYSWKNSKCVADTRTANCTGLPSTGASWNTATSITQTWSGSTWQPSTTGSYNTNASTTECRFKCNTNYSWKNSKCEADTKTVNCTGLPANAQWNTASSITQTWNGSSWQPTTTGSYNTTASSAECRFKCKTNYTWDGSKCAANTRTENCTTIPANASWNSVSAIIQTWNGEDWTPSNSSTYNTTASTSECRYKCADSYHTENGGASCISNTKTASCTGLIANAQWNSVSSITQTWNGSAWTPSTAATYNTTASTTQCQYKCNSTHYWYNSECTSPCDYEPCDEVTHSTGCTATSWRDYSCECDNGYVWNGSTCKKTLPLGNICTGQNKCYNNSSSITCPSSPSTDFYGQDAYYASLGKCTPQSFTVQTISNPKVVVDNNTGLMWQQKISIKYKWDDAVSYCNSLSDGGYSDWRLPTPQELMTIIDNSNTKEPSIDTTYFPNTPSNYFWSSSTVVSNTSFAWFVDFTSGNMNGTTGYKANTNYVRCVRGESLPKSTFKSTTVNGSDVIVTDTATGLIWQKTCVSKTWQEALKYCENLTYAGYSDWRLPNKNELVSLVNYEKYNPASDFPNMTSENFWSSSSRTSAAWCVLFSNGEAAAPGKSNSYYVRCVRN